MTKQTSLETARITNQTKSRHSTHPLHFPTKHTTARQNKQTTFNNYKYIIHIKTWKNVTPAHIKQNLKSIHTTAVSGKINRLVQVTALLINTSQAPLTKTQNK